jgi:toxin-antitoxin system PIN domain toxin
MKTCLLDVNVLLAIAWPHHTHHGIVHQWWQTAGLTKWATSTQTQLGFIRVSCNSKFAPTPATPGQSLQLLIQMLARPDHEFWPEIAGGVTEVELGRRLRTSLSHGHITDAYLAALANHHGGQLATLDRSLVARHPDVAVLVS